MLLMYKDFMFDINIEFPQIYFSGVVSYIVEPLVLCLD